MMSSQRRGRPPTASLPQKVKEGRVSNSKHKCHKCDRAFPRAKSLKAHILTHTGVRPYKCDYPHCGAAFAQSGHLRTHVYRHTGECPYRCPTSGCGERYAHSSRHCKIHDPQKKFKLVRDGQERIIIKRNLKEDEVQWFEKYRMKKSLQGIKRPYYDSDEENIPVNNKRTPINNGFTSTGSASPSSSHTSTGSELLCTNFAECEEVLTVESSCSLKDKLFDECNPTASASSSVTLTARSESSCSSFADCVEVVPAISSFSLKDESFNELNTTGSASPSSSQTSTAESESGYSDLGYEQVRFGGCIEKVAFDDEQAWKNLYFLKHKKFPEEDSW